MHRLTILWALALLVSTPAHANKRVALIVANASYANVSALKNPPGDAQLIAASLLKAGFTVETAQNLTKAQMDVRLRNFSESSDGADVALVYFAGHGIEARGRNYLIPTDARLLRDRDADVEAVSLDTVTGMLEGARLRLVILDACRENPFDGKMARPNGGRSVGRGLQRVEPEGETLVVYAAKAGAIAADGTGANSPFATSLAKRLIEPGLEVNMVFRRVRDDVLNATGRQQEPFVYGSLSSQEFYFLKPVAGAVTMAAAPSVVADPNQMEALVWQGALKADRADAYRDYLDRYPNGNFVALARSNLARLSPTSNPIQNADASNAGFSTSTSAPRTNVGPSRWGLSEVDFNTLDGTELVARALAVSTLDQIRDAAAGSDPWAAYLMGSSSTHGLGLVVDHAEAMRWFQRAVELGNAFANYDIGWMYEKGRGVTKDARQAYRYYRLAAAAGHVKADKIVKRSVPF